MKWLFGILFFFSCFAFAQNTGKTKPVRQKPGVQRPAPQFSIPAVRSFHQLMYMPDDKRAEYIRDLRLALSVVERSMIARMKLGGKPNAELETWKEEVQALLLRLGNVALPQAFADEPDCPVGYDFSSQFRRCVRAVSNNAVRCPPGQRLVEDGGQKFCAQNVRQPTIAPRPAARSQTGFQADGPDASPQGANAVTPKSQTGFQADGPDASPQGANAVTRKNQTGFQADGPDASPQGANAVTRKNQTGFQTDGPDASPQGANAVTPKSQTGFQADGPDASPQGANAVTRKSQTGFQTDGPDASPQGANAVTPKSQTGFQADGPDASPQGANAVQPAPKIAAAEEKTDAAKPQSAGEEMIPLPEDPKKCGARGDAKDYHKSAGEYYKSQSGHSGNCLVGGMFSKYKGGEIKSGNCEKVQTFPTNGGSEEGKLKCSGNKGMCNPMLYCGPKKGEAWCLPVTQDFTKSCEAKAKPGCDPFKEPTLVQGAKEQWLEFKHDMDGLCMKSAKGSRFNEYFCNECHFLKKRMEEIDKKYSGYKAPGESSSGNPNDNGGPTTQPSSESSSGIAK